jgi:hypothetical protein
MFIDGRGYAVGGVAGSLAIDATVGIAACLLLGLLLYHLPGKAFGADVSAAESLNALPQED